MQRHSSLHWSIKLKLIFMNQLTRLSILIIAQRHIKHKTDLDFGPLYFDPDWRMEFVLSKLICDEHLARWSSYNGPDLMMNGVLLMVHVTYHDIHLIIKYVVKLRSIRKDISEVFNENRCILFFGQISAGPKAQFLGFK